MAALPYIGTVILLPLYVFDRFYTLCFLEQYGPHWRFAVLDPQQSLCEQCDYDLRGNTSGVCPECGTPVSSPTSQPPPV